MAEDPKAIAVCEKTFPITVAGGFEVRSQGLAELQDASVWKVPNLYVNEPNLARFKIWGKDECGCFGRWGWKP